LTASGILPHHVFDTMVRLLTGFAIAAVVGVAIGIAMGRSRRAEDIVLPLVASARRSPASPTRRCSCYGFGLGNVGAVLLVGFVSASGDLQHLDRCEAVKEIWVRSAQAMGADNRRLFPPRDPAGRAALCIDGLRLGLAQAWRILVVVEMLAAVPWAWVGSFSARRIPQYRRDARRHRRDRGDRARPPSISCSNAWKTSPWCAGG